MKIIKLAKVIYEYIHQQEQDSEKQGKKQDKKQESDVIRAIDGVDLEVEEGQFIAILGHNGSGKSTLARHLNALLLPTEGTIWIDGNDTANSDVLLQIRQTVGMVFQNPDNQIVAGVVEEDVGFGPENLGVPTKEIWNRVDNALESVDIEQYRSYAPNHLSGGQKQRVAIAGVLAMHPKCIVLDEATAMLDPLGRKEVLQTVRKLNKQEHITVILITHYMEEVVDADKVFVMDSGHIVMQGTPPEIFIQSETLHNYGLAVPQITELANQLQQEGIQLTGNILTVEDMVEAICQYV